MKLLTNINGVIRMYSKIFKEIVEVMHHDYAGYIDKIGWDRPNDYKKRIPNLERNNALNTTLFSEIVNDYLLDFKDPHVYFNRNVMISSSLVIYLEK